MCIVVYCLSTNNIYFSIFNMVYCLSTNNIYYVYLISAFLQCPFGSNNLNRHGRQIQFTVRGNTICRALMEVIARLVPVISANCSEYKVRNKRQLDGIQNCHHLVFAPVPLLDNKRTQFSKILKRNSPGYFYL